jgi:nucleotide-binding universal stress UspA family protein
MLHNVLVCLDASRGEDALRQCRSVATEFARHYGARLTGLHVKPLPQPIAPVGYPPELALGASMAMVAMEEAARAQDPELRLREAEAERLMAEDFLAAAKAADVEATFHSVTGDPVEMIIEHAHSADLVLLPDAPEARAWPLMRLVRSIARPVLLASHAVVPIKKIAVAYDGSVGADRALQLAVDLTLSWAHDKPDIVLLAVAEAPGDRAEVLKPAERYLQGYHLNYSTHISQGRTADMIVASADEEEATLLVMGAYGHSALREAVLGSTTDEVVEKRHQPLILCH